MSANDILDVLNVQRDSQNQPPKKKQKVGNEQTSMPRQTGMARELYNLLGPNTPPVNMSVASGNTGIRDKLNMKPSPWTKMPFTPVTSKAGDQVELFHWVKGSKELLEQEEATNKKPYFFEKFNTKLDLPGLMDEEAYNVFMAELKEQEMKQIEEQKEKEEKEKEEQKEKEEKEKEEQNKKKDQKEDQKEKEDPDKVNETDKKDNDEKNDDSSQVDNKASESEKQPAKEEKLQDTNSERDISEWTYQETKHLFELCNAYELKWPVIYDRFKNPDRTLEDIKEQFYRVCAKIIESQSNSNPALVENLKAFSKSKEIERKQYLESLLKRTPAEIAEEESLVIEARRFELAAKKMLIERSHLLTLLDSPQTTQSVQQYQSSQGLANLYNNLMIIDKHQKKRQFQQQQRTNNSNSHDPIPPPIPIAASSSFKKERNFQTHLQQYLSGFLKQNPSSNDSKQEANAIQQLLMKRLTVKEEEAYGLHYHANEKLTPGVILRSTQRLPGLQQRQSVLKSVNSILQELDIPTAGGTSWKPVMPTRKTMAKYDELLKSVVALLDVKKGRDKLESEIRLIKSQRGLQ
ncbi:uncharacterized protein AC631_05004 [Debaryomyces fabryi]|uniref:SWR1-complex protein 4 n=1 Tax=Debaryomyces fabryi TaxID=58627 RepID=A0A0V1PSX6_9ASCO|nr:uncharacterized protein AC631_05004 [Debaryomyces fabryi]KRZ99236.1 hypothetical protein AC631_05004 [Debaryomyces fabryi]CUM55711.1 unnamed protein product [Debaryomyces fabryi]